MNGGFSFRRFGAVLYKEFIQMRRDRITFGMMIGLPMVQLFLFGFAINADPRHLPTLVEMGDNGPLTPRGDRRACSNRGISTFAGRWRGSARARRRCGGARPTSSWSSRRISSATWCAGSAPEILVAADASDPSAVGGAAAALQGIVNVAIARDADRAAGDAGGCGRRSRWSVHREYNPEGKTSTNIVPGLLAIILSMTMVMITAVAIVKETRARHDGDADRDAGAAVRGDAGQDPALCVRGLCADAGVPRRGARGVRRAVRGELWAAFFIGFNLFIVVNLALGFLISTAARNQMQAMQLSFFTILPSILLSGFMFPFAGMPGWAQFIGTGGAGDALPARHPRGDAEGRRGGGCGRRVRRAGGSSSW